MARSVEILRKMDEAQTKGDLDAMFSVFTDDVVVHIGGRSKLAGDYKGPDQLRETFGRFMQALGDGAEFETHDIVGNDTHGIMLQRFRSMRGGERIEIAGIGIFHFQGEKISEAWFVDLDPYTADKFYDANL